ncbi:MAG: PhoH family protein [Gammaproteobacteria bacterium]|nr:MAG: PhoH family protein [Gammaproteobacteria bacterium]
MTPEDIGKRIFVLDTNVLMHDPSAIFRFQEHDLFLPMKVLEELDNNKRGPSDIARNARQASRFMNDLISNADKKDIDKGFKLPTPETSTDIKSGRLFFQTSELDVELPKSLPGDSPDNNILATVLALKNSHKGRQITLVSKDINLRIKATVLGINAEDYTSDQVLEDVDLLYNGHTVLPEDFWDTHDKNMESWQEDGRTFYRLTGPLVKDWYPNQCLSTQEVNGFEAVVCSVDNGTAVIKHVRNFRDQGHSVWGIMSRNIEQNFALNILLDPEVDFVSLLGNAGTGKTLLSLAAGLTQVLDEKRYNEIIMTRVTISVGEDIGFLPGTEEEKMTPWMGALMDNLEVLNMEVEGGEWGRAATADLLENRIKIRSLNFMRGRTFLNKFIIIDEAQNLTSKQMKTLITRAGPGTKVVCLGNVAQIDTPYLTETTSGLTYVVDRFKDWEHSGHITLLRGERSRLADFASDQL